MFHCLLIFAVVFCVPSMLAAPVVREFQPLRGDKLSARGDSLDSGQSSNTPPESPHAPWLLGSLEQEQHGQSPQRQQTPPLTDHSSGLDLGLSLAPPHAPNAPVEQGGQGRPPSSSSWDLPSAHTSVPGTGLRVDIATSHIPPLYGNPARDPFTHFRANALANRVPVVAPPYDRLPTSSYTGFRNSLPAVQMAMSSQPTDHRDPGSSWNLRSDHTSLPPRLLVPPLMHPSADIPTGSSHHFALLHDHAAARHVDPPSRRIYTDFRLSHPTDQMADRTHPSQPGSHPLAALAEDGTASSSRPKKKAKTAEQDGSGPSRGEQN